LTTPADAALQRLSAIGRTRFFASPTPIEPLPHLVDALGPWTASRRPFDLFVKRDDAIPFGFGGNKVRKLELVAAQAQAEHADVLITTGGVQSNHARATAAAAARMGLGCVLVVNGAPPETLRANALLDRLLGADVRYVPTREARAPAMEQVAGELRSQGRRPFVIPLGASTPIGAAAFALAFGEMLAQMPAPDTIVLSTSSGGTQAGLIAGCRLNGASTRIIGISADDPAEGIAREVRRNLEGLEHLLGMPARSLTDAPIEIDDRFVGAGYGIATPQSQEAIELCARRGALFLDHTYTGKAMAGLMAKGRAGAFDGRTVLFWHTGGQVGLFV
jgi:1-aminocyclopropane-1-carboxylate deaminase/D-cysteine desulfhydrase-like pyridoxal-dependent ACC family enzyme